MKTLRLTIKKKWFDLIVSGEKKEEYREIKEYWIKRIWPDYKQAAFVKGSKTHDLVKLVNGYSKSSPSVTLELLDVSAGLGSQSLGAPEFEDVFILSLGKIIELENYPQEGAA